MELDGNASLKSRCAVAEALQVDPAALDGENGSAAEHSPEIPFGYPGAREIPSRVRSPLLVMFLVLFGLLQFFANSPPHDRGDVGAGSRQRFSLPAADGIAT